MPVSETQSPDSAPEGETKATRRPGRPTEREVPRTTLATWMEEHQVSSAGLAAACTQAAEQLGIPTDHVPNRKSIDDMRIARFYPGTIAMLLIHQATGGAVGLEQWARDLIKFGTRSRRRAA